ncbi:MAG: Heme A synthase [Anaerolineales bacterium]|nr:Heme A synthase [Anaerolineales bacterium]
MAESNVRVGAQLVGQRERARADVRLSEDRSFRWIAAASVIATYALIVLGGIVRVTESGLGCPDWPLCHGQLIPPLHGPTLLEYAHRLVTTGVTPLILLTAVLAWRRYRRVPSIFVPALVAVVLLDIQIVLGGITVLLELPQAIVSLHLINAILLLGVVLYIATQTFEAAAEVGARLRNQSGYRGLVALGTLATFGLIVIGAEVRGSGAGPACLGFPACGDVWLPRNWLGQLHMIHRLAAVIVGLLVMGIVAQTWRTYSQADALKVAAGVAACAFLSQFAVGIAQVTMGLSAALRALHLALATVLWGGLATLATLTFYPRTKEIA